MKRPVTDMLRARSGDLWLHMPGHGGQAVFPEKDLTALDLTELDDTDDLYHARNGLKQAQDLYAACADAGTSLFLHNGSTQGMHAMLEMGLRDGDTVILPRNAHLSAVNACILGNLRIEWIPVRMTADGYAYVDAEDAAEAVRKHPEAKRILVTRPDYYGGCMDLTAVCRAAGEAGMDVVADEAHGAHLPWYPRIPSASAWNVRAWTQSCHKTLPALTGSAVLQLRNAEDAAAALRVVRREQTSSPSFLLMRSIDDARAWMEEHGTGMLENRARLLQQVARRLEEMGFADPRPGWARESGCVFDDTRLVVSGIGPGTAEALAACGIQAEMYDGHRLVLLPPVSFGEKEAERFLGAMETAVPCGNMPPAVPGMIPPRVMDVREAALAESEWIPLEKAGNRIAAESAGIYPPGIPLVVPGEMITGEVVERLAGQRKEHRFGMEEERILCVKM